MNLNSSVYTCLFSTSLHIETGSWTTARCEISKKLMTTCLKFSVSKFKTDCVEAQGNNEITKGSRYCQSSKYGPKYTRCCLEF